MKDAFNSISVRIGALLGGACARALRTVAAGLILVSVSAGANALDFFGLFGSEAPPPISKTALSYAVTIDIAGDDKSLANAVMDASSLYKLRRDAPPDGDSLARRATRDFAPLIDALWGAGYYDARVVVSIDDVSLIIGATEISAFSRVAESYRDRAVAPVKITISPGPLFQLRSIRVLNSSSVLYPTP